jgi:hypothetical protein
MQNGATWWLAASLISLGWSGCARPCAPLGEPPAAIAVAPAPPNPDRFRIEPGRYVTSWLGNTFGGADGQHVQGHIQDMFVSPEGRVYATTWWDEDCREQCAYQGGKPVLWFPPFGHSNSRAVTANEKYLFFGYGGFGKSKEALIRRFDRRGPIQTRRDDRNPAQYYPQAGEVRTATHDIRGLAVVADELFASIERENVILVFDVKSLKERRRIEFPFPGKLVASREGRLWVIQHMERRGGKDPVLVEITPGGKRTGRTITGVVNPRALAVHPHGQLLVGENGPRNKVLIFDISPDRQPREVATFGESLLADPAGRMTPTRFDGITGVGADAKGNFYIAADGNLRGRAAGDGSGTVLRSLTRGGDLNWELLGLEFLENVGIDPLHDARDVYTLFHHYRMDYGRPPGKEWNCVAYTLDRFRYPDDIRITGKHRYAFGFARIEGRAFLYVTSQWPGNVDVYRFDGHIAVPAVRFTGIHEGGFPWPEGGAKGDDVSDRFGSIWRDLNGDGQMQPEEFKAGARTWQWGRYVDAASGDLWGASGSSVLRIRCEGLDAHGVPVYRHEGMTRFKSPEPFTDLRRVAYDPKTDSLYLSGSTTQLPRVNQYRDDRSMGRALARYDDWSKEPTLRWVVPLARSDGGFIVAGRQHRQAGAAELPQGLAHAGDYVFVGAVNPPHIHALSKETGAVVQTFKPGPEVGGVAGWLDIPMPFNALRRADGEYLVFVEEGARHKVLIYRWRPPAPATTDRKPD